MQQAVDTDLLEQGDTGAKRLTIFDNIHALGDKEDYKERNSSKCSDSSYQDTMEQTLGSSYDGATESEDFAEVIENIQLDLSLGDIPIVD